MTQGSLHLRSGDPFDGDSDHHEDTRGGQRAGLPGCPRAGDVRAFDAICDEGERSDRYAKDTGTERVSQRQALRRDRRVEGWAMRTHGCGAGLLDDASFIRAAGELGIEIVGLDENVNPKWGALKREGE